MKVLQIAARVTAVLIIAWALAWTWYWSGWDMLVYDIYSCCVFKGDPIAVDTAEFDTSITVCVLLASFVVWGTTRLWRKWRRLNVTG